MLRVELLIATDDPEIADLCKLYWATDADGQYLHAVKELTERFGLKSGQVNQLVRNNSEAFTLDRTCPRCDKGFPVHSRTELTQSAYWPDSACGKCRTELAAIQERKSDELRSAQRATIISTCAITERNPISLEDIDLRSAMALGALIRDGEPRESGIIVPLVVRSQKLAPTYTLEIQLMRSLYTDGIILVHPSSPIEAFDWKDGSSAFPNSFYADQVAYYLAGRGHATERVVRLESDLESVLPYDAWPTSWADQFPQFWREIAVAECEAFLVCQLAQRRLEFNPGAQTAAVIEQGLQWFTIGQLFNLLWRAARDAGDYWTRENVPKKQAANSAVTRFRAHVERAYAEGWSLKPYTRDRRLPISAISHLLFTSSLRLADPLSFNPLSDSSKSPTKLRWGKLNDEGFERLIFSLVCEAEGYADVDWLMKTNAPDHGRDVGATRIRTDSLSGYSQERVVIQCKHWLSRSIRDDDIHKEIVSVEHWVNPVVDVLVIATSGRFTADAVSWVERHNAKGVRPRVEMWNDAKLENLLADRPHLVLSFELR